MNAKKPTYILLKQFFYMQIAVALKKIMNKIFTVLRIPRIHF